MYQEVMLPCWRDEARKRPNFSSLVAKLGGLLGDDEAYEELRNRYKYCQEEGSSQSTSLMVKTVSPPCPGEGYIAMEEVTMPSASFEPDPVEGGYIGLAQIRYAT